MGEREKAQSGLLAAAWREDLADLWMRIGKRGPLGAVSGIGAGLAVFGARKDFSRIEYVLRVKALLHIPHRLKLGRGMH